MFNLWTFNSNITGQLFGDVPGEAELGVGHGVALFARVVAAGGAVLVDRNQQDLVEGGAEVTKQRKPV